MAQIWIGNWLSLCAESTILPIAHIRKSVEDFIAYAKASPKKEFFVTRIGCGLAGYSDEEIAPFFRDVPTNCAMPAEWKQYIGPNAQHAASTAPEEMGEDFSAAPTP